MTYLTDETNLLPEKMHVEFSKVVPVQCNGARANVVKSLHQLDDGGLSTPTAIDDGVRIIKRHKSHHSNKKAVRTLVQPKQQCCPPRRSARIHLAHWFPVS